MKKNAFLKKVLSSDPWSIDTAILVLRLCCALMLLHGWSKFKDFDESSTDWPDPFHVGSVASYTLTVIAELLCTLFVVAGLFTRIFLVPLVVLTIVIVFIIHSGEPFAEREHGLLYLMLYLVLMFAGPGKYSIDRLIRKRQ
jgi:putative oxidoreductase